MFDKELHTLILQNVEKKITYGKCMLLLYILFSVAILQYYVTWLSIAFCRNQHTWLKPDAKHRKISYKIINSEYILQIVY